MYRALRNLGALPQGQAPNAEEFNAVNALIPSLIDELEGREIAYVPDLDVIEDHLFLPLAHCLAWTAAPEFSQYDDQALAALKERAEKDMREMRAAAPTYQPLRVEYF